MGSRIDALSVDDLQNLVNQECASYYTAKDVRDLLSNLYQRAMASNSNRGRVTQNLAKFIILPSLEERDAVPFTPEEVQKIWSAYEGGEVFAGYILLMCYTGMMPGELLNCRRDMVDIDAQEIRGAGAKTATRKRSAIAYPDFLQPVVVELLQLRSENANAKNVNLVPMNRDRWYARFYEVIAAAGIDNPKTVGKDGRDAHRLTPYSCRHTYGTEAVKIGLHPAMIQKMLRHASAKTQERYTHIGSPELHDAVNKMRKKSANL